MKEFLSALVIGTALPMYVGLAIRTASQNEEPQTIDTSPWSWQQGVTKYDGEKEETWAVVAEKAKGWKWEYALTSPDPEKGCTDPRCIGCTHTEKENGDVVSCKKWRLHLDVELEAITTGEYNKDPLWACQHAMAHVEARQEQGGKE